MIMHWIVRILADGLLVPIVVLAGYALLRYVPRSGRYEVYCRIVMAGLTAYVVAKLLGSVYQPESERPFASLGLQAGALSLNNPGFPSDHALFAAFLTLAVWFETRAKKLTLTLAVLTVIMSIGRVVAHVHTPIDVTGGMLVACVGALWYLQAGKKLKPDQALAKKTKI